MNDHSHDRPLAYGEELALTQRLIDSGDRKHALHHCLGAVVAEPHRREWHPLLAQLLESRELVTALEEDTFFGAKAALAFHLHGHGRTPEALQLIAGTASVMPHLGFQRWFATWLEESAAADAPVDADPVLRMLLLATTFGIGRIRLLPSEEAAARELVPIARFAGETIDNSQVLMLASAVMRRAGHAREAVTLAERSVQGGDVLITATALGLALRAAGDHARALTVFEDAYKHSGDAIYRQEKFRALADAGRWREAEALSIEIARTMELDDENRQEYAWVAKACATNAPPPATPPLDVVRRRALGHGAMPRMLDATANVLRQIGDSLGVGDGSPTERGVAIRAATIEIAVSGAEGPSARLCQALMLGGTTDPQQAAYSADAVPRMIIDVADQYTLWKRDGDVNVQALPPPPDAVLEWVEQLALLDEDGIEPSSVHASTTDFLDLWTGSATRARPAATAREWVAATIHPRMPIFRVGAGPDWVYRWQVCALLGLARSGEPWEGSTTRDALLSLLRGVVDWPLAAAIRVAVEVALHDPTALRELRQELIDLAPHVEDIPNGGIPWLLAFSLEALPYVPPHIVENLRTALDRKRDEDGEDGDGDDDDRDDRASAAGPPGEASTPPKRPWWKFWGN